MPQIRIHISKAVTDENKRNMVRAIREAIPAALHIDANIGQVMLYETDYRACHESRSQDFVFVEVTMYAGRSMELKQELADRILAHVQEYTGVDGKDINLVYYELSPDQYFGGTTHKYIDELKKQSAY